MGPMGSISELMSAVRCFLTPAIGGIEGVAVKELSGVVVLEVVEFGAELGSRLVAVNSGTLSLSMRNLADSTGVIGIPMGLVG